MLDDYFKRAEILRRHRAGFFGSYLDSYTSVAKERGYPRQTPTKQKPARYRPGDQLLAFLEGLWT